MKSDKAKAVIWYFHKYKEDYIQEVSRKLYSYSTPVRYWIKTLQNCWLLESRVSTYKDNRIYYHLNYEQYPNIIGSLITLIRYWKGVETLNQFITPRKRTNRTIVDKQTDSVKGKRKRF